MFSNVVVKSHFKLWCVLCAVQCVTQSQTARHTIHIAASNTFDHNIAEHMTDVFLLIPQNCNFSKVRHRLPDDGPDGPKHVGATMR